MQIIQEFMQIYMYELEKYLETKKEEMKQDSFQSDEANTDRSLKEFLKRTIESSFCSIPETTEISSVQFEGTVGTDMETLKTIKIKKVFLPEDITDEIREIVKASKNAISR